MRAKPWENGLAFSVRQGLVRTFRSRNGDGRRRRLRRGVTGLLRPKGLSRSQKGLDAPDSSPVGGDISALVETEIRPIITAVSAISLTFERRIDGLMTA